MSDQPFPWQVRSCRMARDILVDAGVATKRIDYVNRYGGPPGAKPVIENSDFYALRGVAAPGLDSEEPETYAVIVFPTPDGRTHERVLAEPGEGFPTSVDAPLTQEDFDAITRAALAGQEAYRRDEG